ncbi:uncharacterized protein LOC116210380 [Punica granatum]|uniref:Cotton fiber protein n=2 Tax=Punica granatum TaxID=22663 RepID=A0A218XNR7_PUNGR|nr:uncharacterized protein LOC116210380 [Punica granatum]OWM86306.1 hypothetical protein CDL15_Pgr011130 [Punica granatum]PKI33601.1 hypothetical protein CRG98_046012 [Punica granatum]
MPKRRPLVILKRVSNLLKRSVYIAKLSTKPIIPRLILLKKSRKACRKSYHYQFLQEYEFSPSSTPLIGYNTRELNRKRFRGITNSLFYLCGCLGEATTSPAMDGDYAPLALPPAIGDAFLGNTDFDSVDGEEDSVDQRAERFIENFYEEMRMQRRASI